MPFESVDQTFHPYQCPTGKDPITYFSLIKLQMRSASLSLTGKSNKLIRPWSTVAWIQDTKAKQKKEASF